MRSKDCTLKQIYEELDAYREALTQCHKSIDSGIFSSIITPQLEVLDVVREVGEIQDRISLTYKIYNDIYCLISLIMEIILLGSILYVKKWASVFRKL